MTRSERLSAIEARERAATEGPWTARRCWERPYPGHPNGDPPGSYGTMPGSACEIVTPRLPDPRNPGKTYRRRVVEDTNPEECCHMMREPDAAFIAASRADVPWLLKVVRAYEKGLQTIATGKLHGDTAAGVAQGVLAAMESADDE